MLIWKKKLIWKHNESFFFLKCCITKNFWYYVSVKMFFLTIEYSVFQYLWKSSIGTEITHKMKRNFDYLNIDKKVIYALIIKLKVYSNIKLKNLYKDCV